MRPLPPLSPQHGVAPMDEPLWTFEEISAAAGAPLEAGGIASGVSIDSRTLMPGDLFVAIRGEKSDGHKFVEAAFEKGATAAIVEVRLRSFSRPRPLPGARYARSAECARSRGSWKDERPDRRSDRQRRQDRNERDAARHAFPDGQDARLREILQQSLGCSAFAGADAQKRKVRRFRNRHEPRGRDYAAYPSGAPPHRYRHHGCSGSYRVLQLSRRDSGREGRDLRRFGARRRSYPSRGQ